MSPRAACRLEALGFGEVHDYTAGKVDWLARGLPRQGEKEAEPRAIDLVIDDVVTCGLGDPVGEVCERVRTSRYGFALVVSPGGVLLGRLRRAALEGPGDVTAEAVMEPGPSRHAIVRASTAGGKWSGNSKQNAAQRASGSIASGCFACHRHDACHCGVPHSDDGLKRQHSRQHALTTIAPGGQDPSSIPLGEAPGKPPKSPRGGGNTACST